MTPPQGRQQQQQQQQLRRPPPLSKLEGLSNNNNNNNICKSRKVSGQNESVVHTDLVSQALSSAFPTLDLSSATTTTAAAIGNLVQVVSAPQQQQQQQPQVIIGADGSISLSLANIVGEVPVINLQQQQSQSQSVEEVFWATLGSASGGKEESQQGMFFSSNHSVLCNVRVLYCSRYCTWYLRIFGNPLFCKSNLKCSI